MVHWKIFPRQYSHKRLYSGLAGIIYLEAPDVADCHVTG
jgi:hypothetical protein